MKKLYKNLLLGIASILCTSAMAQVSGYIFAQSNGTYTPITGGTVVATATSNATPGNLAATTWNLPTGTFPFPFEFNGISYTGCNISCNCYISFGTAAPTLGTPISGTTAYDGAVSAWGRTNNGVFNLGTVAPFYTSEIRVEVIGSAPTRTVVIQYDNWRYSSGTSATAYLLDFQIRLSEKTNAIEIVYGPGIMTSGSLSTLGFNVQVGLRGATNADFNNRSSTGAFDASTAGTANNASQAFAISGGVGTTMPADGLTYRWYPPCKSASALVTPSVTVNSTLVCSGDTLNFGANGETPYFDITYQWQESSNPSGPFSNVNGPLGTAFGSYSTAATGGIIYYVLVTTCSTVPSSAISNTIAVDTRSVPVLNIFSNPALNTTVTPIETCAGESYTLTATGANTYTWVGGPNTDSYVVQPAGNPSYVVTGMSTDGCIATTTLDILVNPLPVISVLASPNTLCPGQTVVIGASGSAVTYTWITENSSAFLITATPTISTTYSVIGTAANGCTNMAIQPILVYSVAPLVVSSTNMGTMCKGEEVTLSALGAFTYTWAAPGEYAIGPVVPMSPVQTTTYAVTGMDVNGCTTQTILVQKVSACSGLNEESGNLNGLHIYPNPNNGVFTVELGNGADKTFELMDLTGKIVLSASTSSDTAELSMSGLASGIYYLRVQSNTDVQIVKVVKH